MACILLPDVAGAQGGQQVGDAQVATLDPASAPPQGLRSLPALGGLAFYAPSVKAGFFGRVTTEGGTYSPVAAGDELVYVSVDAYSFAPPFGQTADHYGAPGLAVTFAGHSVSLPESPDSTVSGVAGSAYGDEGTYFPGHWVVAVPRGTPVRLVASEDGFSQAVDLRSGLRVGSAPTVLYRSQSGPLSLDLRPNLASSMVVDAGGHHVMFPVTVTEAALSFFDLASPDSTLGRDPNQAYLFVSVSVGIGSDESGRADWYFDPGATSEAADVTVGGHPVAAIGGPPAPDPGDSGDHLAGLFTFVVPATLTSATVTVHPSSGLSVYFQGPDDLSPTAEAVAGTTPATFRISFPPVSAPAAISTPPSTAPGPRSTSTLSVTAASSGSSGGTPARARAGGDNANWLGVGGGAAGGAVLVLVGVVFISRRTRLVEPRPVTPGSDPPSDSTSTLAVDDDGQSEATSSTVGNGVAPTAYAERVPAEAVTVLPRLRVRVIGPLELEGTVEVIRRRTVLRALIVLAVSLGHPLSSEELRYNLADAEDSEPSASTVRSELSRLRRVLPAGLLPEREPGVGYSLTVDDVEVDWIEFADSIRRTARAEGNDRLDVALRALRLVRGPVLAHQSWHGIDSRVWEMTATIERTAVDAATVANEQGRPDAAAAAARQGLLAVPSSPQLWRLRIEAARAGSGENVEELVVRARTLLGADFPS